MERQKSLVKNLVCNQIDFEEFENSISIYYSPFKFVVHYQKDELIFEETIISGWNMLTDFMEMKFKNALKYALGFPVVFFLIFFFVVENMVNYYYFLLGLGVFLLIKLIFYNRYYKKEQRIKKILLNWVKEHKDEF